jgi:hypothetical protein
LLQFKAEGQQGYSFKKLGRYSNFRHNFLFARIVAETYFSSSKDEETSANVYFIFEK